MAKQLKDVLAGVKASKRIKTVLGKDPGVDYRPKAKDEADWADKHEIERHEDRAGNGDDVYQAKNVKYSLASPKEDKHGMERPKDKKVYEAKEVEEAVCNESPAGKMCPVHGLKECSTMSRLREDEKYIGFTKLKRKLIGEAKKEVNEESSPMIKPPSNMFDNKSDAFAHAKKHGGKVLRSTFTNPRTGTQSITFKVVKEEQINEVMKKSDPAGKWISDFVHSDNPKFKGKSPEKRKQMALAAYYAKQRNEDLAMPLLGSHDSDEAVDMLKTELKALANKAMHLVMAMPDGMHVEPWVQSKIAQAKEMVSSVHDYMVYGDHDKEEKEQTAPYEGGIDPSSGMVRNTYPDFSADVNTGRNV